MIFCIGEGKYESKGIGYQKNDHIFNVKVSEEEFKKAKDSQPSFKLPIAVWKKKEKMIDDEKEKASGWSEMGGYLKTLSYKDAWKNGWPTASKEFKDWVKNLPNFNAEIFEQITGIKFESEVKEMTLVELEKVLGHKVKIIN